MSSTDRSLDTILVDLGEFGKYQKFVFVWICFSIVVHATVNVFYVFSAMDLKYRCKILDCELNNATDYNPEWLQNAVPFVAGSPSRCNRYAYKNSSSSTCTADAFDRNQVERCDSFVYQTKEISVVNDFNIHCDDNTWKLTMIGTINNFGQFIGLPITGIISDRYGRRTALILGTALCGLAGLIKSFTTTFTWFLIFEFIDAALGTGTYSCAFILGVELVGPAKRVAAGTAVSACYALGEIILGGVAWLTQSWRPLTQILYPPSFIILIYFWVTPESVRWLISKRRFSEATTILRKVAKVNKTKVSENALAKLSLVGDEEEKKSKYPLLEVLKSKILMLRFINCCFTWMTCAFLFYGLILNSVSLATNAYLDFILTSTVEIPAYIATYLVLDKFGRRTCQSGALFLTGVACFAFIFLKQEKEWLRITAYLIGKFGATSAFVVCYVITSEMFPTPLRHSLLGICSMIGRIGSMLSPQMPLLAQIWAPLPLALFSVMSVIAGILALFFPETLNTRLPDTIEEAENIGQPVDIRQLELLRKDSFQNNKSS